MPEDPQSKEEGQDFDSVGGFDGSQGARTPPDRDHQPPSPNDQSVSDQEADLIHVGTGAGPRSNEQGQLKRRLANARDGSSAKRSKSQKPRSQPHSDVKASAGVTSTEGDEQNKVSRLGTEAARGGEGNQVPRPGADAARHDEEDKAPHPRAEIARRDEEDKAPHPSAEVAQVDKDAQRDGDMDFEFENQHRK